MFQNGCRAANICEQLARIRAHPGQTTRDIALMRLRAQDNFNLSQAMLDIPGFSREARQTARFRSAGALVKLDQWPRAARELWQGIKEAPLLLPVNRLLWGRLLLDLKKRKARWM